MTTSEQLSEAKELYFDIKEALHGAQESEKQCQWQLPLANKKKDCVPINCKPNIVDLTQDIK